MIPIKEGRLRDVFAVEKDDTEVPEGAVLVGHNGQFEVSSSEVFSYVKPLKKESTFSLKEIQPGLKIKKKIPWNQFWPGAQWLREKYAEHAKTTGKSSKEFILILFYNKEKDEYSWFPPKQDGHSAHVDYTTSEDEDVVKLIEDGNVIVGTMHNHFGKGSAFQSSTDHADEAKHGIPMIHFTMGWMDAPNLYMSEFDIRFVAGKECNKKLTFDQIVEAPAEMKVPEEWDKKLEVKYEAPRTITQYWKHHSYDPKTGIQKFTGFPRGGFPSGDWSDPDTWEDYYMRGYAQDEEDDPTVSTYYSPSDWDSDLTISKGVISAGYNGKRVDELRKSLKEINSIAGGRHVVMTLAILQALVEDLKSIVMTDEGFFVDVMDEREIADLLIDLLKTVSSADDTLNKFAKEQTIALKKDD